MESWKLCISAAQFMSAQKMCSLYYIIECLRGLIYNVLSMYLYSSHCSLLKYACMYHFIQSETLIMALTTSPRPVHACCIYATVDEWLPLKLPHPRSAPIH